MTSSKRLLILLVLIFNAMTVCALLFGTTQQLPFLSKSISISLVTMALTFPIPFAMSYLYQRTVPKVRSLDKSLHTTNRI